MIPFLFDYATPSAFESDRERSALGLAADGRRPVRLHARVAASGVVPLRLALQALGELIWSSDSWLSSGDYMASVLDPVVTVFRDRVLFEAFSQDESACGIVAVERSLLEPVGEVREGTTNVDFTAWLWAALAEMRSSRETWLRVGNEGLEVRTEGFGSRFERRVELPESWVRAFLQLHAAMALPGTRLSVRPVDLLAAIRFLSFTRAKVSPRALRYEMQPGEDARLVLEPWEHVVPLRGAEHAYAEPRTIRTWGRRRLRLLERLLAYAESVEVFLKGRALPSFYAVRLPGVVFVLGLSGFTDARFSTSAFSLEGRVDEAVLAQAAALLREAPHGLSLPALGARLGVPNDAAGRALARLARRGQVLFDVEARAYRFRELLPPGADEARLFPPDERDEEARRMLDAGEVRVTASEPRETRRLKRLKTPEGPVQREVVHRDWRFLGEAGSESAVEVVVDDGGRVIFGTCGCPHFRDNLLNLGACAHMRALLAAAEPARQDLPSSEPAQAEPEPSRTRPTREDEQESREDEEEEPEEPEEEA